jgi:protein-S-isoprenylcysteine O-methyltransferase Ste14
MGKFFYRTSIFIIVSLVFCVAVYWLMYSDQFGDRLANNWTVTARVMLFLIVFALYVWFTTNMLRRWDKSVEDKANNRERLG